MVSAAKRPRTKGSSSTSVTSKLTPQSASTSTSAAAPDTNPTKETKRAIIEPYKDCLSRVSVSKFFYTHDYKEQRDLFLRAMSDMMNKSNIDDPWSYYAIAGIHGFPKESYDSAKAPERGRGYCEHGTVLFPTWHRPYVLLFEQAIIHAAVNIADNLEDATDADKDKCRKTANSLRVPYLNWESSFTAYQGLPDVFTRVTIDVKYPKKEKTTIPNPLRSYVLPVNLSKPISASDVFNPIAKPNYQIPASGTPFTPANYSTVRHPDATYQSQVDRLNLSVQRSCNLVFRPQLFAAMLQTDWAKFSNHYSEPVDGQKIIENRHFYGHFASIEVVHDAFHDAIGGPGGHMTHPDIAAFDPIFWFHHCNVDRLLAMWQYANPTAYVPDSGTTGTDVKNNKTPLTPFWSYKAADKVEYQYLNSLDVQSIKDWKYTYPVLHSANENHWSPETMKSYIMRTFYPDNHYGIRWYLNILKLPKRLDVGPYNVHVFIDLPEANIHTPLSSPNYAGSVFVFARSRDSDCKTCENVHYVCGSVELTSTMKRLGITVDTELENITEPISRKNPPTDPFNKSVHKFTLVYVTAAGNEDFTWVYVTGADKDKFTLTNVIQAGNEINLKEKPSGDSTGKHRTEPILHLSWAAFFDTKTIGRGDIKPEQMKNVSYPLYYATTSETSKTSEPLYTGGIMKTNALS